MEEKLKFGISINKLWQLEQDITINHGISRVQEKLMTCKSGVQTQDGGRSSCSKESTSVTSNRQTDVLM